MPSKNVDRIDIYIRLNEDPEKDYCLSLKKDIQVKDLKNLFTKIPVLLSPNYFHGAVPSGFKVSAHPGHLTQEGAVLFDYNADYEEHLVSVDQLATVEEAFVPGCLVIPVWEFKPLRYYGILFPLLFWWYLDWPDFLSPTPGHQPSVLLGNFLAQYSDLIRDEVLNADAFEGRHWDWLFFVFHTIKVALVWIVFRVGIINLYSLNPMNKGKGPKQEDLTADLLMDLGWTSVRRMLPDDWDQKHRDHVIAKFDGALVKAYASGALNVKSSVPLNDGEGWSVLKKKGGLESVRVGKNFLDENDKFVISEQYLRAIGTYAQGLMQKAIEASSDEDVTPLEQTAKDIRKFGFMDGPKPLKDMYLKIEKDRNPKNKPIRERET